MLAPNRLVPVLKASSRAFSSSRPALDVAKVTLVGRLGVEPTARTASNGKQYYQYVIATRDGPSLKNESGQYVDASTSWHTVFSFNERQHESIARLTKGSTIYVEAELAMKPSEKINDQNVPPRALLTQNVLRVIKKAGGDGYGQEETTANP